jgi:quercetin dioxygenase-like cupin family protein
MSGRDVDQVPAPIASSPPMTIVRRDELPTLRSVVVEGVEHNLGVLKDFRKHPVLGDFLPESARLAMSWVRLTPGEMLEPHVHPIASMIIVATGRGHTLGDLETDFGDGDVIVIPSGRHHGFVGAGEAGFWALSIQFEERGLYERPQAPLVKFHAEAPPVGHEGSSSSLELLLRRNEEFCAQHRDNPLFALVLGGRLEDEARRRRFLACVQAWSNWFQRAMLLRSALTADVRFSGLFREHLDEEYGHDRLLARERGSDEFVWDPILEAASSWFASSMLTLDNAEKAVLVHMVLEAASSTFMAEAQPVLDSYGAMSYFSLHNEADDDHVAMAEDVLRGLPAKTYQRLFTVQEQGWQMLNALCARIAELSDVDRA